MGQERSEPRRTGWPTSRAWGILLLATGFTSAAVLWLGRNIRFTGDEMTIISRAAELGPGDLIDPYVGHLIAIPLIAYKGLIETVGTADYAPFQILTLLAIFLLASGVLVWASRRLPQSVALVPAVLLVFFPADVLHFVAGNGFVVVLPLALGVWALVLWDRADARGDAGAAVLLLLALSTYTVGAAFAVGVLVAALIGDRRRLWVGAVPLIAYALWRLLVASGSVDVGDAQPDWANLLLLPAWTFQSVGEVLAALSGVGFDFTGARFTGDPTAGDSLAPVLAAGFFALIIWRLRRGEALPVFWGVVAIALALFASQVLVWGTLDGRGEPGEERYLYPGAAVVLLLAVELIRPIEWNRVTLAILWSGTAIALISATGFLINIIDRKESGTGIARAQVTAMQILAETSAPGLQRAKTVVRNDFDPVVTSRFEGLGFDEATLPKQRTFFTKEVDGFLVVALGIGLKPVPADSPIGPCRPAVTGAGGERIFLPEGGAVLEASRDLDLALGRYGRDASRRLGLLGAGKRALLAIPPDAGTRPWFLEVVPGSSGSLADLSLCRAPRG